jgi:amino acid adenylation domain-containing protein
MFDVADTTVPARFAAMVTAGPDRVAVVSPAAAITYAELATRADHVADLLRCCNPSERPVTILAEHGITCVTAMLGVAASGRAFLILDPVEPLASMSATVLRHGGGPIVTDRQHAEVAHRLPNAREVVVTDDQPDITEHTNHPDLDPLALASVSATSGSSGVPKAVMHSHRNIVANAVRYSTAIDASVHDRFLVVGAMSAQAAATPIFSALLSGATLCTYDLRRLGAPHLAAFVQRSGVTVAHVPPAALAALAQHAPMPDVRLVSLGGDRVTAEQAARARRVFPCATLLHRYSTSETNWIAGSTVAADAPLPDTTMPIGHPVPWMTVRLVDIAGNEVAPGEVGEIEVTSSHLALGYLDDPERTAQRFRQTAHGRAYRTGDRARRAPDGSLEFAGRADDVRKVRGVLVDLAAVDAALVALPEVEAAAVVTVDRPDRTDLVAFVTGTKRTARSLRAQLAATLPAAMVPAVIIVLESLPVTPRGKIDRTALSTMATQDDASSSSTESAPANAMERDVAAVFARVLSQPQFPRDGDLFASGADSLAVLEIATALSAQLGRSVPVSVLLERPTPALLAHWLAESGRQRRDSCAVRLQVGEADRIAVAVFSGGGGGHVAGAALLAQHLPRRTVYGIVPHGFEQRARADRTLEAMGQRAARDLAALGLRSIVLVGHSSGGNVALEAARHLERLGVAVPTVVLLDTLAMTTEVIEGRRLGAWLRWTIDTNRRARKAEGLQTSGRHLLVWPAQFIARRLHQWWLAITAGTIVRHGDAQHAAFDANVRRALRHRPVERYSGRVHLVRANDVPGRVSPADLRWSGVLDADALTIDRLAASHDDLLRAPQMDAVTIIVERECLGAERDSSTR